MKQEFAQPNEEGLLAQAQVQGALVKILPYRPSALLKYAGES